MSIKFDVFSLNFDFKWVQVLTRSKIQGNKFFFEVIQHNNLYNNICYLKNTSTFVGPNSSYKYDQMQME